MMGRATPGWHSGPPKIRYAILSVAPEIELTWLLGALPYCAATAGLSRMSLAGFVSSSSAMPSRDFTKSENER
jgi:hypothetical protein